MVVLFPGESNNRKIFLNRFWYGVGEMFNLGLAVGLILLVYAPCLILWCANAPHEDDLNPDRD